MVPSAELVRRSWGEPVAPPMLESLRSNLQLTLPEVAEAEGFPDAPAPGPPIPLDGLWFALCLWPVCWLLL